MEPPPSVSWRVTLLPTLFPLNSVKEELRGNWISEDEERVESNSIDSVLARTTERIRMDCRELSSGASHYEQHFSDTSGLNGRNIILYGHSDFCVENYLHTRIVESRPLYLPRSALSAQLGSLTRTSQMSDDTNEDESCKSVFSSYYIQTEALGTALLETGRVALYRRRVDTTQEFDGITYHKDFSARKQELGTNAATRMFQGQRRYICY